MLEHDRPSRSQKSGSRIYQLCSNRRGFQLLCGALYLDHEPHSTVQPAVQPVRDCRTLLIAKGKEMEGFLAQTVNYMDHQCIKNLPLCIELLINQVLSDAP
jgi:hypothetical protein